MSSATATLTSSPTVVPTASTVALTLANVLYEKRGAIAYVTLNRPKVLNALNSPTWKELRNKSLTQRAYRVPLPRVTSGEQPAGSLRQPSWTRPVFQQHRL